MSRSVNLPGPLLLAAVALGAALGALLRWGVGEALHPEGPWDWSLWGINVVGAGLLGWCTAWPAVQSRPLLAVAAGPGLLGGFTSVSAAAEEVRALLADQPLTAVAWWGSMLLASVLAVQLGRACAKAAKMPGTRGHGGTP